MNTTRPAEWPKSGWYWCLHHEVLLEWTDDIAERWAYVIAEKSKNELQRRLLYMRPVKDQAKAFEIMTERKPLGDDYWAKRKALDDDYWAKRKPLGDDYWAKRKALDDDYWAKRKALGDELTAFHAAEYPGCPWNGKTIFVQETGR